MNYVFLRLALKLWKEFLKYSESWFGERFSHTCLIQDLMSYSMMFYALISILVVMFHVWWYAYDMNIPLEFKLATRDL